MGLLDSKTRQVTRETTRADSSQRRRGLEVIKVRLLGLLILVVMVFALLYGTQVGKVRVARGNPPDSKADRRSA